MKRVLKPGILLMAVVGLAACGGGGGGGDADNNSNVALPVVSTVLEGVALDGYLRQAKVCLDLNDNLVCEVGEPYAFTDSNGHYRLSAPSLEAANAHRVMVEVIAGLTTDADAPTTAIPNSYVLTAPLGQHQVITPISTMLHHLLQGQPGLRQDEAEAQLRVRFSMPAELKLTGDYAVANATTEQRSLHAVARRMAWAMGVGLKGVRTALGGTIPDADKRAAVALVMKQTLDRSFEINASFESNTVNEAALSFDFRNVRGQLATALLNQTAVLGDLGFLAQGLYRPFAVPLASTNILGYNTAEPLAVSPSVTSYRDVVWQKALFNPNTQQFQPYYPIRTVLKAGRWTRISEAESCRYTVLAKGFHYRCDDDSEADLVFKELPIAGAGIDAVLRFALFNMTAQAWAVADQWQFSAAARGYYVSGQLTADTLVLGRAVTNENDETRPTYASLDAAMQTFRSVPGENRPTFRIGSGLAAQFETTTGDQGALLLLGYDYVGNEWKQLSRKGAWRRTMVGEEELLEFAVPPLYYLYSGDTVYRWSGWTLYTPPGGSPTVHRVDVNKAGAPFLQFYFNTAAMDDLKAARGTAVPAS